MTTDPLDLDGLTAFLGREAFASMMGTPSVLVFEDPRWGRQAIACIEGAVVPYGLFGSLLTARITGLSPQIAIPESQHDDAIAALWERVELPAAVRTEYGHAIEPHVIVSGLITQALNRLRDPDADVRKERLQAFVGAIEARFLAARDAPIATRALPMLNAPVLRPKKKKQIPALEMDFY